MDIYINEDRAALGLAAGKAIASALREKLAADGAASVAFAAAPSQNETLAALIAEPDIAWDRITAYHLDEYAGATPDSPHAFRRYLQEHAFHKVTPLAFHQIRGEAEDPLSECARYAELLPADGFDIALLGIGENGHLAFNDPPCDFEDPAPVRVVKLDEACRIQQVHDGAFSKLSDVPTEAFTLTIPALMAAKKLFVMVPGPTKAAAVAATLEGPITNECPASILRNHNHAKLFLDRDSSPRPLRLPPRPLRETP
jgi:glucosamine-6-phosphate deaminase